MTDKQWNLVVDYCADPDPEYEKTEDLIFDFIEKRELMEEVSDKYEEMWLETHGNPYPFDKDGNDTQADSESLNDYGKQKAELRAWLDKYGKPTFVESVDISSVSPNQVWTEWWLENRFVMNHYVPNEDRSLDVNGYYITPNPWSSEPESEVVFTAMREYCAECETEDGDECPACEGYGYRMIDLL